MPKYEICEKVFVYYTVDAETEEEAWQKLDKIKVPYGDSEITCVDIFECDITEIWENENER
jgi:hypothetical protein